MNYSSIPGKRNLRPPNIDSSDKREKINRGDCPKTNNAGVYVASYLLHKPGTLRSLLPVYSL
jgi:hypothetical protein